MLPAAFHAPENARQNGGVPSPSTVIEPHVEERTANDRPWVVIVWNDPINLMAYVTFVFQKLFGYSKEKAEIHMMEVHQKGRSIVWTGARERAEGYVQQLQGHLLLTTLEKSRFPNPWFHRKVPAMLPQLAPNCSATLNRSRPKYPDAIRVPLVPRRTLPLALRSEK